MLPTLWLLAIAIVYVGKGGAFDVMHHYRHGLRLLRTDVDVITSRLPASELPAAIVNHAEYNSVMQLRGTSGPESVQKALQIVQRLILQLDRSDKRADLGPEVLANRFNSFFSTCLQLSGSSWTATLGPLEYVGVKLSDYLSEAVVNDERIRIADITGLCKRSASCLLDLDISEESCLSTLARLSPSSQDSILDLSMSLSRILLRYAIFRDQLESHTSPSTDSLLTTSTSSDVFNSIELSMQSGESYEEVLVPS